MTIEKEKLQKIVAISCGALIAGVVYYYTVVDAVQLKSMSDLNGKISQLQSKLDKSKECDKRVALLSASFKEDEPFLATHEAKIVKGDQVAWLWREMGDFAEKEKMNRVAVIPEPGGQNGLPEEGAYTTTTASLAMGCGYHKLGAFVQDLENWFPTLQIQHIEILGGSGSSPEMHTIRLQFQILALREDKVKPNNGQRLTQVTSKSE